MKQGAITLYPSFPGGTKGQVPNGFSRIPCSPEQTEWLERQALEVFTSMANSGYSFRATLATLFLSGMALAQEVGRGEWGPG